MIVVPSLVRSVIASRWLRAAMVAAAVAAWPACSMERKASHETLPAAKLDYTLKDVSGRDVRLADFKGKPLVINFWATWCGPCKLEVPYFVELAEKYRAEGLTIVGVSVDDTAEDIKAFGNEYKVNYPLLVGAGHDDLMEAYNAALEIPVTWFIHADGTVSFSEKGIHPKEWFEAQVRALFE